MDMVELDRDIEVVITSAWAESTLKTRNCQWGKFIDFCNANNLTPLPADVTTVARFLVHLARTCVFSTCNNYLSAIVSLHKFFGHEKSFREFFLIQLVLKGLGRRLGKSVSQKVGLTPTELCKMYIHIDLSEVNAITQWAALILSFRTLLRKSNIVPTVYDKYEMVISRQDVEFTADGIVLNVRKTKTLQRQEYVLKIPVNFVDKTCLCAASMLITHLSRTDHIKEGPLFYMRKKGLWKPLLYSDLLSFLKRSVSCIGLSPTDVGLHSMRRSGAGFLHSIGISLIDIMNAGDWRSLAALSYLISPFSRKLEIEKQSVAVLSSY